MNRHIRWVMLVIVKPLFALWIMVNGVPPTVRALCGGVERIIKECRR